MTGDVATTNLMLGIMAVVSVLEALLLIGMGVAALTMYRRVMDLATGIEQRHVAPALARVNAILDDVKDVTAMVKQETERVDHAIRGAMDRVDDTAGRVRASVRAKTSRVVGFAVGLRAMVEQLFRSQEPRASEPRGAH